MIINININTADPLDEHERVILLALAGEISLSAATAADEPLAADHPALAVADKEGYERGWDAAVTEFKPEISEEGEPEPSEAESATEDKPKRARVVNVSDESLKKYDFHRGLDGQIVCDHCDYVSETGRALHLHAGTHKAQAKDAELRAKAAQQSQEAVKAIQEKALKSVPAPKEPEAGVDAFLGTEEDVADAEKAAAGDPEDTLAETQKAMVEATVVETDPKVLRDTVAKVATEMVAAQKQAEIRYVLNNVLGGVPRVSMINEKDLQKFLDAEPIAAFIAAQNKKAG